MEVIVIESAAWKALIFEIEESRKLVKAMFSQMTANSQDKWLSLDEAAKYAGFKPRWIRERSAKIGAFQDGCGLRFKRSDIDAYMLKHYFKQR